MKKCHWCGKKSITTCCSKYCHDKTKESNLKSYHKNKQKNLLNKKRSRFKSYHKNRAKSLKAVVKWRKDNPDKVKATAKIYREKNKNIDKVRQKHQKYEKKECKFCKKTKDLQRHHQDYSGKLSRTMVLCHKHHLEEHKRMKKIKLEGVERQ